MVVIVFGLPGSGKTYFAEQLARQLDATYYSTDRERNKMLTERTYGENEKATVYDSLLQKVREAVGHQRHLIVDGTFYKRQLRDKFSNALNFTQCFWIEIQANETTIRSRLAKPRIDSEADFAVYKKVKAQWEPMREPHLTLSSNSDITNMISEAMRYIKI